MFIQALIEERADGRADARTRMAERLFRSAQRQLESRPEAKETPLCGFGRAGLTDLSYTAGGLFFALLYEEAGHDRFISLIDAFRKTHPDGASCAEFASAARAAGPGAKKLADEWPNGASGMRRLAEEKSVHELFAAYRR